MTKATFHGKKRAKERMGVPKRATTRTFERALSLGKHRSAFTGRFRKYLDTLYVKGKEYGTYAEVVVFGNNIYLVGTRDGEQHLVTTWPVPWHFRKDRPPRFKEREEDLTDV